MCLDSIKLKERFLLDTHIAAGPRECSRSPPRGCWQNSPDRCVEHARSSLIRNEEKERNKSMETARTVTCIMHAYTETGTPSKGIRRSRCIRGRHGYSIQLHRNKRDQLGILSWQSGQRSRRLMVLSRWVSTAV